MSTVTTFLRPTPRGNKGRALTGIGVGKERWVHNRERNRDHSETGRVGGVFLKLP